MSQHRTSPFPWASSDHIWMQQPLPFIAQSGRCGEVEIEREAGTPRRALMYPAIHSLPLAIARSGEAGVAAFP